MEINSRGFHVDPCEDTDEMGTVYRLEHKDTKRGPYATAHATNLTRDDVDALNNAHDNTALYPVMYPEKDQRCGCESVHALRDWFGRFIQALYAVGFVVRKYTATLTRTSERQCLFMAPDAVMEHTYDTYEEWAAVPA